LDLVHRTHCKFQQYLALYGPLFALHLPSDALHAVPRQ
jgi:hypothetical protein